MYKKIYKCPLDDIILTSDGIYLTGLYFKNSNDAKKHIDNYTEKDLEIFDETIKWLDIYFSGNNPNFTPKYKIKLTDFEQQVTDIMNLKKQLHMDKSQKSLQRKKVLKKCHHKQ